MLVDGRILSRIVKAAGIGAGDLCLEIGPGTGNLTRRLLDRGAYVTAVELDDRFAATLAEKAESIPGRPLAIIHANILDLDLGPVISEIISRPDTQGQGGVLKVVANLPYNVATAVIIKLIEAADAGADIQSMTLLIQKEVAERIAAAPGNPARGSLSVFCQERADCSPGFIVPPSAFRPPPAVNSMVLRVVLKKNREKNPQTDGFFDVLTYGGFEHPRKTCYNSIRMSMKKGVCQTLSASIASSKTGSPEEFLNLIFGNAEIGTDKRAHQLSNAEWRKLADEASHIIR